MAKKPKDEIEHMQWLIKHRSEIQLTLLALYEYVHMPHIANPTLHHPLLIDHLVAAAFSLWRAVFLAETERDWETISKGQKDFLKKAHFRQRYHLCG
jgi:hypothetical protein